MTMLVRRLGQTRSGLWLIKHVNAPLDRALYRLTGGRLSTGGTIAPILLVTTTGRRSGEPRTNPVFYLADGERLVVCNVNHAPDRRPAWPLNVRVRPAVTAQIGSTSAAYLAREAADDEIARYWPRLVAIWPAYERLLERGGERSIFILEPVPIAQPELDAIPHPAG